MEIDYTKMLKQGIRFYTFRGHPIPYMKNGISMSQLIIVGLLVGGLSIFGLIGLFLQVTWIQHAFTKGWLLLFGGIILLTWILFTLNWDKKNFWLYALDRFSFQKQQMIQYEHGHHVAHPIETTVVYITKGR
ncbi:TcpE family conjugal transfer membrane protein [Listeria sp. ILCC797]|uniref:TcpE family conjugal transfer membrane protein n=1 Tax=Listeria sp. ILCC797 TaxID=1918333 RepID=UPI000B5972ED|nr:TcpE family conjugal transfer membrane protein [Listeria sp. ILCC797]